MPLKPLTRDRRRAALDHGRVLIAQTWKTQLNLSLFLALLVVSVFLMPVMGVDHQYRKFWADLIYTVILSSGVAIAWGQRRLFIFSACVAAIALGIRWTSWWTGTDDLTVWREMAT